MVIIILLLTYICSSTNRDWSEQTAHLNTYNLNATLSQHNTGLKAITPACIQVLQASSLYHYVTV